MILIAAKGDDLWIGFSVLGGGGATEIEERFGLSKLPED